MYKLKQMSSVCLIKTIWSPQVTWTEICDFSSCKYLNKDSKKRSSRALFNFRFQSTIYKGLFIKGQINFHISLQNPEGNSKTLGALQNPESSNPSLSQLFPRRINQLIYHQTLGRPENFKLLEMSRFWNLSWAENFRMVDIGINA